VDRFKGVRTSLIFGLILFPVSIYNYRDALAAGEKLPFRVRREVEIKKIVNAVNSERKELNSSDDVLSKLKDLSALKENGHMSEIEFEALKAKILSE
jgi:hypothetical protein